MAVAAMVAPATIAARRRGMVAKARSVSRKYAGLQSESAIAVRTMAVVEAGGSTSMAVNRSASAMVIASADHEAISNIDIGRSATAAITAACRGAILMAIAISA